MDSLEAVHHPILVPVDFSCSSTEALQLAGEIAQSNHRPLVVLHVVHGAVTGEPDDADTRPRNGAVSLTQLAAEQLERLMHEVTTRCPDLAPLQAVRTVLVDGLPVNRILEVAERENAGLIVMGSHGRDGLSRLLMGSVAEAVTRKSRVPVTIVKNS